MNRTLLKSMTGEITVQEVKTVNVTEKLQQYGVKSISFNVQQDKTGATPVPMMSEDGKYITTSYIDSAKFLKNMDDKGILTDRDALDMLNIKAAEQKEGRITFGPTVTIEFENGMILEKATKIIPGKQKVTISLERANVAANKELKGSGEAIIKIDDKMHGKNVHSKDAHIAIAGGRSWDGGSGFIASSAAVFVKRELLDYVNSYMTSMLFGDDAEYEFIEPGKTESVGNSNSSSDTNLLSI